MSDHLLFKTGFTLAQEGFAAGEVVFFPFDETVQSGLKGGMFKIKIPVDRAVGFLKTQ